MPKQAEIPSELKEFNKLFEQFHYRHDSYDMFTSLLDLIMMKFMRDPKRLAEIKKRFGEDMDIMNEMVKQFFLIMEDQLKGRKWYDMLGTYYEALSSRSQKSHFGQFFTPEHVCDLMAKMAVPANITGQGKKISDPACGSGRCLLAIHTQNLGNYVFGEDLDVTCCKMAIINLCLHGAVGEIVHHDSLLPDTFYGGWHINADMYKTKKPSIRKIKKEESFIMKFWENKKIIKQKAA